MSKVTTKALPNGLVRHSSTITLPGGMEAEVAWFDGCNEGNIFVHPEWARNSPEGSHAEWVAIARAEKCVPDRDLEWVFITG